MTHIVVVDDDERARTAVRVVLEDQGYDITEARDGNEALQVVRAHPPGLILCDIFMPLKDGFETIRQLRRDFPAVPVVAMSGGSGGMDVLRLARHLGAVDVLYKPLHHAGLVGLVRRLTASA